MKMKRLPIGKILENNKSAFVLSLISAIVIWLIIAMQFSDLQITSLSEIPVQVDTTMTDKLDLQMFGQTNFKVTVNVKGKRYEISPASLSAEDFIVSASTANVSTSGKHTLPVNVRFKDGRRNVEIVSFSPETIEVYFDHNIDKNCAVEVQVEAKDNVVAAEGFVAGDANCSISQVTISGAATEVNKIDRVVAKINIDSPLDKTTKFENTAITILNRDGGVIHSIYFSIVGGSETATVNVPIYKEVAFTPTVLFMNSPSFFMDHPVSYVCSPYGSVNAAVPTELLSSAESLPLGSIDFSEINAGFNTFTFKSEDIKNIRILDDIEEFNVSFTLEGFTTKTFEVPLENVTFNNLPRGLTVKAGEGDTIEITVVGSALELERIHPDSIHITADASSAQRGAETAKLPLSFTLDNVTSSWVYGKYTADFRIS